MKNRIIKLEKERVVKQFPSNGEKPAEAKPFFIIGKKDENLKNLSIGA
jgi:hypothetical protein